MSESSIIIRQAHASDRDPVGRLWLELLTSQGALDDRFAPADDAIERWNNDFPEWISRGARWIFVAEEGEAAVGFVTAERYSPQPVYRWTPEVYIDELYVASSHRRSGIGTRLVEAVSSRARDAGARRLRAGVLVANEDGRRFWEKFGARDFAVTFTAELEPSSAETERRKGKLGF